MKKPHELTDNELQAYLKKVLPKAKAGDIKFKKIYKALKSEQDKREEDKSQETIFEIENVDEKLDHDDVEIVEENDDNLIAEDSKQEDSKIKKNKKKIKKTEKEKLNLIKDKWAKLKPLHKYIIFSFIFFCIGFIAGREHLRYEIRNKITEGLSGFANAMSNIGKNINTVSKPKAKKIEKIDSRRDKMISITLKEKEFLEQDYQHFVFMKFHCMLGEGEKNIRSAKGAFIFTDLFGDVQKQLRYTFDDELTKDNFSYIIEPGMKYNQFVDSDKWMRGTDIKDLKVFFRVTDVIYSDGTTEKF